MPDEEETNPLPVQLAPLVVPQFSGGSDPFSPNGIFVENLRDSSEDDDLDELRASMQQMGWINELPAIRDERGVVLAGHRRLKVAAELGIEPVWLDVRLGFGQAPDVERLKIALASNVAFKPMTPTSRKRIAAYLYGDVGWSMEKIGGALRVNKATISRDLGENPVVADATTDRVSKRGRVGEGRPRKTEAEKTAQAPQAPQAPQAAPTRPILNPRPPDDGPRIAPATAPQAAPQPSPPLSAEERRRIAEERPLIITQLAALLALDSGKTLDDLVRAIGHANVKALPQPKRVALARGFLHALNLSDADLRPLT